MEALLLKQRYMSIEMLLTRDGIASLCAKNPTCHRDVTAMTLSCLALSTILSPGEQSNVSAILFRKDTVYAKKRLK
jgi:hypothetical protein